MESGANSTYQNNSSKFAIIFFAIIFYLSIFSPTSSVGVLRDVESTIAQWAVLSCVIITAMVLYAKVAIKQLVIIFCIITFMVLITAWSSRNDVNSEFSLARLAPVMCFLASSLLIIKSVIPLKWIKFFINLFMIIFVIWNGLIISGNEWIKIFTINNYTQLYDSATSNMFIKNRPVMSFGIYTFATYFYFLFFFIIRKLFVITKNKLYFIYMWLLLIGTILLFSNTTAVFAIIMYVYILWSYKSYSYRTFIILLGCIGLYFIITNEVITAYYLESFTSSDNGVTGRYFGGSLNRNSLYLQSNPFIGFNIIRYTDITYTDSGYAVNYLMGGVVLVIAMYYCLYRFIKNNFGHEWLSIFIPLMIFEFALPYTIYYKSIYFMLILTFSYKSIQASLQPKSE